MPRYLRYGSFEDALAKRGGWRLKIVDGQEFFVTEIEPEMYGGEWRWLGLPGQGARPIRHGTTCMLPSWA